MFASVALSLQIYYTDVTPLYSYLYTYLLTYLLTYQPLCGAAAAAAGLHTRPGAESLPGTVPVCLFTCLVYVSGLCL